MNITLRQLQVFSSAARHLNYTRAAEELFLTQPAVSMQIKQLEESVGLPLFEQQGKKLFLTEAGRELFHYSREVNRQLEEAESVLAELRGLKRGRLDLAVVTTANSFATHLLANFSRRFEGVKINLSVTNRASLLRLLEQNEIDLVLMGLPPEGMDVTVEPFLANPLVVVASPNHPLVGQRNIPIQRLAQENFVMREKGSGTRIAMERFFDAHNLPMETGMVMSSSEAIRQAVGAGLGLTVASVHTLALELETGRLCILDVEGFPIRRQWHIVHRKAKRLSPLAQAFKAFVLSEATSLFSKSHLPDFLQEVLAHEPNA